MVDEKTVIIKLRPDALLGGDARSPASEDPSRSPIELTAATFLRFSTPGRAFHNANRRLPLSGAECSSSLEETAISPALTPVGASRRNGPVWEECLPEPRPCLNAAFQCSRRPMT